MPAEATEVMAAVTAMGMVTGMVTGTVAMETVTAMDMAVRGAMVAEKAVAEAQHRARRLLPAPLPARQASPQLLELESMALPALLA